MTKLLLLLAAALLAPVVGQPKFPPLSNPSAFDHVKNDFVRPGIKWLEVGFFYISQKHWSNVLATYTNWTDPVVFLSLPNLAGNYATNGTSVSLRIDKAKLTFVNKNYKTYAFQAKSYQANDSYCSTGYYYTYDQTHLNDSFIAWMVVERGLFNVSNKAFGINKDKINRTNVNDTASNPYNFRKSFLPTGCFGSVLAPCTLTVSDTNLIGSIAQLQTLNYPRFLLLRGAGVPFARRFARYLLLPHDSANMANYYIPDPGETYAFMLFQANTLLNCIENLAIETYLYQVNYLKKDILYSNTYKALPGIFGQIMTDAGRDSVGLRSFSPTFNGNSFITQEDECFDQETIHVNNEQVAILIIGQIATVGSTTCGMIFNQAAPTTSPSATPSAIPSTSPTARPSASPSAIPSSARPSATPSNSPGTFTPSSSVPSSSPSAVPSSALPSARPTASPSAFPTRFPSLRPTYAKVTEYSICVTLYDEFGDGWGPNVAVNVTLGDGSTQLLYLQCPDNYGGPYCFTASSDETMSVRVVQLNPPTPEKWEIYYTVNWVDSVNKVDQMFVGDIDTTMVASFYDFVTTNGIDTSDDRDCKRCKHPPKPNPGAGGEGAGGEGAGEGHGDAETVGEHRMLSNSSTGGSSSGSSEGPPHWPFPVTLFDPTESGKHNYPLNNDETQNP